MKPRTIVIESPACESEEGACPFLGNPESTCSGRTGCWGVDDEDCRIGIDKTVIDEGDGEFPRFKRHVECPFGTADIEVTVRAVSDLVAVAAPTLALVQ